MRKPLSLRQHYEYACMFWGTGGLAEWHAAGILHWNAFCMSWVTIAWAMLVGKA